MVEAKSVAEIEIFSSVDKKNTQNTLNDKIKITFIDMSNKDTIYNARQVEDKVIEMKLRWLSLIK